MPKWQVLLTFASIAGLLSGPAALLAEPLPARLAEFKRVLGVPTSALAVGLDRVAVVETRFDTSTWWPQAVWILTDRAKTRLALPESSTPLQSPHLWFDASNGALLMHAIVGWDAEHSSNWLWDGHWVSKLPKEPPEPSNLLSAPFEGAPAQLQDEFGLTRIIDGRKRPWTVGTSGAYAFDEGVWWRVVGLPPSLVQIGVRGGDQVWLTSPLGLYRGKLTRAEPLSVEDPLRAARPIPPLAVEPAPLGKLIRTAPLVVEVERIVLPVIGSTPLFKAHAVAAAPMGHSTLPKPIGFWKCATAMHNCWFRVRTVLQHNRSRLAMQAAGI